MGVELNRSEMIGCRFPNYKTSEIAFRHPSTILACGPSFSGKTTWLIKLINQRHTLIHPSPERIIYSYTAHQPAFETLTRIGVELVKGADYQLDPAQRTLLVIDDPGPQWKGLAHLFTVVSHHSNCTICLVTHNLFQRGEEYRTAVLNAKYFVLFRSPRMLSQIAVLARHCMGISKAVGRGK
jgi:hypothetical protein